MKSLLLLPLALTSCVMPGTFAKIEKDLATGEVSSIEFERRWQAGPVEMTAAKTQDGVTFTWKSDVDLDPAAQVATAQLIAMQSMAQQIQQLAASVAALSVPVPAPVPPVVVPPPAEEPSGE